VLVANVLEDGRGDALGVAVLVAQLLGLAFGIVVQHGVDHVGRNELVDVQVGLGSGAFVQLAKHVRHTLLRLLFESLSAVLRTAFLLPRSLVHLATSASDALAKGSHAVRLLAVEFLLQLAPLLFQFSRVRRSVPVRHLEPTRAVSRLVSHAARARNVGLLFRQLGPQEGGSLASLLCLERLLLFFEAGYHGQVAHLPNASPAPLRNLVDDGVLRVVAFLHGPARFL